MVTTRLYGRMGNQMFQIAAAIGYAKKNGLEFHIPDNTVNNAIWPPEFRHLTNPSYNPALTKVVISEKQHSYAELPYDTIWEKGNIELDGYWQSEKYFEHCRADILKAFADLSPGGIISDMVSIHVRRGDYLNFQDKHPVVTIEYLTEAIRYFSQKGYKYFRVASDDRLWCADNLTRARFPNCEFMFGEFNNSHINDMIVMAGSRHHIIANSSFSWWGHYLCQSPDKICIAPRTWFGPGNKHLETKDIYPQNAIIL